MTTRRHKRQAGITLIELLIGMTITTVISAMLITSWIALSDSYSFTTRDTKAREYARDGVRRLSREIRAAEAVPGYAPIRRAGSFSIQFTTLFNDAGAADVLNTSPVLVGYRLRTGTMPGAYDLWRIKDTDGNGSVSLYTTDTKFKVASYVVRRLRGADLPVLLLRQPPAGSRSGTVPCRPVTSSRSRSGCSSTSTQASRRTAPR